MKFADLAMLGAKHARNAISEALYIHAGLDITKPIAIYGEVVRRCNYKCRYCDHWRRTEIRPEMGVDQWRDALDDLQSFIGRFHIEFYGGEPYLKRGFLDIANHCRDTGLHWGVTTNGSAFRNANIARKTVEARPNNVNVSIDSRRAQVQGHARGVENSLCDILAGLRNLETERRLQGADFSLIVKAVVHRNNFRELPDFVGWASEIGANAVNFQPVARGTKEVDEEFWISGAALDELQGVVEKLAAMKRRGAPIVNSETALRAWPLHFLDGKAPPESMPCRVGLRNFMIRSDGDVETCWMFPAIGNLRRQSAREIWTSPKAALQRGETTRCESLCLFTCLSQKTMRDKVRMASTMFLRGRNPRAQETYDVAAFSGPTGPGE